MARPRLRLTAFARLLIALLIIVPIAYFGATIITGESPIEMAKEWAGLSSPAVEEVSYPSDENNADYEMPPPPMEKAGEREEELNDMRKKLNDMYDENAALKDKVKKLQEELEEARKVKDTVPVKPKKITIEVPQDQ